MNLKRPTNEDSFAEVEAIITAEMQSLYRYGIEHLRKELQKRNLF